MVENLPPGPALPAPLQMLAFARDPVRFLDDCRARWGNVFTVRLPSYPPIVYVADPALVKAVFTGSPDVLRAGEGNSPFEPIVGPRSLLVLDGEEHRRMRRILLPAFHGEQVRAWSSRMTEVAAAEVTRWPIGARFPLRPRMRAVALEIILRVVFGVSDPVRRARLLRVLPGLTEIPFVGIWLPWLRRDLGPWSPWGRFVRARAAVDALLHEEIRGRRDHPEGTGDGDVTSVLLAARHEDGSALGDEEVRDQLVTLLLAGHETTATALSWVFERLVRHPPALARLVDEVDDRGSAWIDAVIQETLRVRPVVIDVVRHLAAPFRLGGWSLPAGVVVAPSIILLHRRADEWPDPLAFRPERWLDRAPDPHAWIPVGGGVRRCLGAGFAHEEMRAVIRAVLRGVRLGTERGPGERPRIHHVTLVPERGAQVVVTARRDTV
ncbi:MAG: cytochrome P450 [Myxococcota bacterium]